MTPSTSQSASSQEILRNIDQSIRKDFETNRRILSFEEYLALLSEKPEQQLRGSAKYILDMLDFYGKEPVVHAKEASSNEPPIYRFRVFDSPIDGMAPKLVGQEEVQTEIYNTLQSFVRQGMNNKLILLHGPNGSAKTTLIHALMGGMNRYSQEPVGAVYRFNWIFPVDRLTKGEMGISYTKEKSSLDTFAHLPEEAISARIPSDLKDHPFLLIPTEQRLDLLKGTLGEKTATKLWERLPYYLTNGDLSHRNKQIFESLLSAYQGDYQRVLKHIQVERFYFSRRYRSGMVTVEPQLQVDAQYSQITMNRGVASLPPSLQTLNLFSLTGDLIDGNRGLIEYSDLLKRPIETFKYLLIACETGSVNVGPSIAFLDTIMLGSSNELQLDGFKEFPDFSSFKARIQLIRVPYLLSVRQEKEIYDLLLPKLSGEKPIAPHVAWTLSLWAVLTRLKKPNSINYPPNVSSIISNLNPLEKARFYDTGDMPVALSLEDRKLLRSNLKKLREEYGNIPYYEGRMGASVREIKSIIHDAVQNPEFPCLSPLSVLRELEDFVKRISEYEFLKQDVKDGYHDVNEFIQTVRNEYLDQVDREVRESIGLYDGQQWEGFIKKYVVHLSHLLKKEKIQNDITGKSEDPDRTLIQEFEKIVQAPQDGTELLSFRQNVIARVGAWSLDHPQEGVIYRRVFPEYWSRIEKHYYEGQKTILTKMHNALLALDSQQTPQPDDATSDGSRLAKQTLENMKSKFGYCDACAKEVITFLMRKRY